MVFEEDYQLMNFSRNIKYTHFLVYFVYTNYTYFDTGWEVMERMDGQGLR